jgi:hypothetical protein
MEIDFALHPGPRLTASTCLTDRHLVVSSLRLSSFFQLKSRPPMPSGSAELCLLAMKPFIALALVRIACRSLRSLRASRKELTSTLPLPGLAPNPSLDSSPPPPSDCQVLSSSLSASPDLALLALNQSLVDLDSSYYHVLWSSCFYISLICWDIAGDALGSVWLPSLVVLFILSLRVFEIS